MARIVYEGSSFGAEPDYLAAFPAPGIMVDPKLLDVRTMKQVASND
jgi:hypothetical protein